MSTNKKIKLIIEVDENLVCEGFERPFTEEERNILIRAIGNGTPLLKGHGRLVDVDKLFRHCGIRDYNCCGDCDKCDYYVVSVNDIREAKTIVEADKENYDE